MQTRAVHFEITENQETSSVLTALERFISLRGRPNLVLSDNQTSFRSADRELINFVRDIDYKILKTRLSENFNSKPIEWKFVPPKSPHFGGS